MAERQRKTPQQRADEALGVATRKVATLKKKRADLNTQRASVQTELEEAERRLAYVRQSPDLAEQTTVDDQLAEANAGDVPPETPEDVPEDDTRDGEERPPYQK